MWLGIPPTCLPAGSVWRMPTSTVIVATGPRTITTTTTNATTTTTMTRSTSLLLLLLSLLSLCAASTPPPLPPPKKPNTPPNPKLTPLPYVAIPTFCKCTCFTNSTIIELGPASDNHPSLRHRSPSPAYQNDKRAASASCDQCNRDFCLQKYNLPICRDAEDKDVSTQCFQRDSFKDRVIVWGFIVGTAGLLGWAGVRGVLEGRVKQSGGTGGLGGGR